MTSFLDSSAEVELALWFHDAVYQPQSITNEVDSANWAQHFLESCGATQEHSQRIYNHIIATKHDPQKLSKDSSFVVDIDLSILGRSQQKYQQFEQNIYLEYSWMPQPIFCRRRIEILEYFLMKSSIYNTEYFRGRYEKQARSNLLGAIEVLRNRSR